MIIRNTPRKIIIIYSFLNNFSLSCNFWLSHPPSFKSSMMSGYNNRLCPLDFLLSYYFIYKLHCIFIQCICRFIKQYNFLIFKKLPVQYLIVVSFPMKIFFTFLSESGSDPPFPEKRRLYIFFISYIFCLCKHPQRFFLQNIPGSNFHVFYNNRSG